MHAVVQVARSVFNSTTRRFALLGSSGTNTREGQAHTEGKGLAKLRKQQSIKARMKSTEGKRSERGIPWHDKESDRRNDIGVIDSHAN